MEVVGACLFYVITGNRAGTCCTALETVHKVTGSYNTISHPLFSVIHSTRRRLHNLPPLPTFQEISRPSPTPKPIGSTRLQLRRNARRDARKQRPREARLHQGVDITDRGSRRRRHEARKRSRRAKAGAEGAGGQD